MLFVLLVVLWVSVSLAAAGTGVEGVQAREGADGLASSEAFLRDLTDGPTHGRAYAATTPPLIPHVTSSGTNDESFYKELEQFLRPGLGEYLATVPNARRYGAGPTALPVPPAPPAPRKLQQPVTQWLPIEPTAYHSIQRRVPQHLRQPKRLTRNRPLRLSDVYFKERKLPRSRKLRRYVSRPMLIDANIDPWRVIQDHHPQPHKTRKRLDRPLTPIVPKPSLKVYLRPPVEPEQKQLQLDITTEAQQFRRPMGYMFGPLLEESPSPSLPADLAGLRQAAEPLQPVPRPRFKYPPETVHWPAADQLPVLQTTSYPPPSPPLPPRMPVTAAVPEPQIMPWSPSTQHKHKSTANKHQRFEKILTFIKKNRKLLMQFIANKRLEMAESGAAKAQTQDAVNVISGAMLLMKDSLRRAQMGKERDDIIVTSDAPPGERTDITWDYDVPQEGRQRYPPIAANQMSATDTTTTPTYLTAVSPPLVTTTKHIMSAKEIAQEKEARLLLARLMAIGGGGGGGAAGGGGPVMRVQDEDVTTKVYIPPHMLDMAPAKGRLIQQLREKHRLCQRHILNPEGPKYRHNGVPYIQAFRAVQGRDFAVTRPPQLLIPICCNCCIKSVLGCE